MLSEIPWELHNLQNKSMEEIFAKTNGIGRLEYKLQNFRWTKTLAKDSKHRQPINQLTC